ncbi:uncharacterized protein LOC119444153 [Dermacentor silvarum]|uniref:uncharacterized protein LOC119444153 n=1 Tax=Dermacentor silvarum TaxID=543639 RepID=UPI0021006B4A|nr:uncharacterized protein LOC119444153 [Dermacentor silvarum]
MVTLQENGIETMTTSASMKDGVQEPRKRSLRFIKRRWPNRTGNLVCYNGDQVTLLARIFSIPGTHGASVVRRPVRTNCALQWSLPARLDVPSTVRNLRLRAGVSDLSIAVLLRAPSRHVSGLRTYPPLLQVMASPELCCSELNKSLWTR